MSKIDHKLFQPFFYLLLLFSIVGLIDFFFFNYQLSYAVLKYQVFHYYVPLIAFPHILSSLILVGREYKRVQIKELAFKKVIPVVLLGIALFYTSKLAFEIFFVMLLTQHVQGQMYGLNAGLNPSFFKQLKIAKQLSYPSSFFAFASIYTPSLNQVLKSYSAFIFPLVCLSLGFFTLYSLYLISKSPRKSMLVFATLYSLGVFFFSFKINFLYWAIVFILGHDLMALVIYCLYYKNSNNNTGNSLLQGFIIPLVLSISFVALTIKLRMPYLVFFFQLAHYFTERYCWKSGSILRERISYES